MKNESRIVIGVDIGGTKVAAGLVNAKGEILARNRTPGATRGTPSHGLTAASEAIRGLFPHTIPHNPARPSRVGAPCPLNPSTETSLNPPHLTIRHNYA